MCWLAVLMLWTLFQCASIKAISTNLVVSGLLCQFQSSEKHLFVLLYNALKWCFSIWIFTLFKSEVCAPLHYTKSKSIFKYKPSYRTLNFLISSIIVFSFLFFSPVNIRIAERIEKSSACLYAILRCMLVCVRKQFSTG